MFASADPTMAELLHLQSQISSSTNTFNSIPSLKVRSASLYVVVVPGEKRNGKTRLDGE